MSGYYSHIEDETLENNNFRKVLFTGPYSQLVVMSLKPGEDIGMEVHDGHDQFFRIEAGQGKAIINGEEFDLLDGDAVVVPSGAEHNVVNTSKEENLKLYTIYSPAEHADGTVHKTKKDSIEE